MSRIESTYFTAPSHGMLMAGSNASLWSMRHWSFEKISLRPWASFTNFRKRDEPHVNHQIHLFGSFCTFSERCSILFRVFLNWETCASTSPPWDCRHPTRDLKLPQGQHRHFQVGRFRILQHPKPQHSNLHFLVLYSSGLSVLFQCVQGWSIQRSKNLQLFSDRVYWTFWSDQQLNGGCNQ